MASSPPSASATSSADPSPHGSESPPTSASSYQRGYRQPSLIPRHSHAPPTSVVSLSSLRDLTATSSSYYNINPSSPSSVSSCSSFSSSSSSPSVSAATDGLETLHLSTSTSQPIPIPKPASTAAHDQPRPVTPLTGRFEEAYYFGPQLPTTTKRPSSHNKYGRRNRSRQHRNRAHNHHHRAELRMRSDNSNFYSPVASATMTSAGRPAADQQPSRSRPQNSTKSVPAFHLSNLPRFHPPVYQPSSGSQAAAGQPPSPVQSRQHTYRQSSGSSRDGMWQYRELMDSVTAPRTVSGQQAPSPSAPRLDPLNSPGPVTPLVLEETNNYFVSGTGGASDLSSRNPSSSAPPPDIIERLMAQNTSKKSSKGR